MCSNKKNKIRPANYSCMSLEPRKYKKKLYIRELSASNPCFCREIESDKGQTKQKKSNQPFFLRNF